MVNNSNLRRRLQEITDEAAASNVTPSELEQMIADLASTHPHSIRCVGKEQSFHRCFAHAFQLTQSETYYRIADIDACSGRKVFFAGSEFARFLTQRGKLQEISQNEARPGDVVIYFDDEEMPEHAGRIVADGKRIKSKWGGGGLLLEHRLYEVPESYGEVVRFYRIILTEEAEWAFLEFAKSREGFDEFVELYELRDLFQKSDSQ